MIDYGQILKHGDFITRPVEGSDWLGEYLPDSKFVVVLVLV